MICFFPASYSATVSGETRAVAAISSNVFPRVSRLIKRLSATVFSHIKGISGFLYFFEILIISSVKFLSSTPVHFRWYLSIIIFIIDLISAKNAGLSSLFSLFNLFPPCLKVFIYSLILISYLSGLIHTLLIYVNN